MNPHQPRSTKLRRRFAVLVLTSLLVLGIAACSTATGLAGSAFEALGLASQGSGASDPRTAENGYISGEQPLSPFDDAAPAIANLDPILRAAIQDAARAAGEDGFEMVIQSGWRSPEYQQALLDDAVVNYGSLEEARKWVSTPEKSAHVSGKAVDVGYTDADSWLSQHGASYGLCQIYSNEMWHFERVIEPGGQCPQQISDASAN